MSIWTDEEQQQLDPEHYQVDDMKRAKQAVISALYDAMVGVNDAELTVELKLPNGKVVQWSSITDDCLTNRRDRQLFTAALDRLGLIDDLALEVDAEDINVIMGGNDEQL